MQIYTHNCVYTHMHTSIAIIVLLMANAIHRLYTILSCWLPMLALIREYKYWDMS